jgi:hypothetical protein
LWLPKILPQMHQYWLNFQMSTEPSYDNSLLSG